MPPTIKAFLSFTEEFSPLKDKKIDCSVQELYDRYSTAIDPYINILSVHEDPLGKIDKSATYIESVETAIKNFQQYSKARPVVVIDFLQLLQNKPSSTFKDDNDGEIILKSYDKRLEMDHIIGALKDLSNVYHVPIIAISSVNRSSYTKSNRYSGDYDISFGKESGVCKNDSTHVAERNAALTVAEAIELIVNGSTELNGRYVLATYAGSYNNGYYISDEGNDVKFMVYKPTLGDYTYETMHIGDAMLLQGELKSYNGTPEYNSGSIIVDYAHKPTCYLDYAITVVNDENASYKPLSEYNKVTTLVLNISAIEVYGGSVNLAWSIKETDLTALLNGNEIVLPDTQSAIITLVATLTYGEESATVEFPNINVIAINSHIHEYNSSTQTCETIVDGVVCGKVNPDYLVYNIKAKELIFNSSTNSKGVGGYTDTFDTTYNGMTWTLVNFNNNNNGWSYVKAGRKSYPSVATMTATISSTVSQIVMTVDAVKSDKINSIRLIITDAQGAEVETVEATGIAKGDLTFNITNIGENLTYKIEIDCASGSSNGLIQISKLIVGKDETHNAVQDGKVDVIGSTCSTVGSVTFVCECGQSHTNEIPTISHTLVDVAEKAPTCYQPGEIAHRTCTVCGKNFNADDEVITDISIPATGEHTFVKSEADSTNPTCTENGEDVLKCSTHGCTAEEKKVTNAFGHLDANDDAVCDRCHQNIGTNYSVTIVYEKASEDIDTSLVSIQTNPEVTLASISANTSFTLTVSSDSYNITNVSANSSDATITGNSVNITITGDLTITITVAKKSVQLAKPVVTVGSDGMATWTAVENAEYEVTVSGTPRRQTETSCQLVDGDTITVKALGYETKTTIYTDSDLSDEQTYVKVLGPLATFTFGENGSAEHNDGSSVTAYTETSNDYVFKFDSSSNVNTNAFIIDGNSALKLGSSKNAGSFTFTVAADVNKVIIRVTGYKANVAKINVNGGTYETAKNAGTASAYTPEYLEIEVDTSINKEVSFKTLSGGYRVMVDSISYYA